MNTDRRALRVTANPPMRRAGFAFGTAATTIAAVDIDLVRLEAIAADDRLQAQITIDGETFFPLPKPADQGRIALKLLADFTGDPAMAVKAAAASEAARVASEASDGAMAAQLRDAPADGEDDRVSRTDHDELLEAHDVLRKRLETLEGDLRDSGVDHGVRTDERDEARRQVSTLTTERDDAVSTVNDLKEQLETVTRERDEAVSKLEAAKGETAKTGKTAKPPA